MVCGSTPPVEPATLPLYPSTPGTPDQSLSVLIRLVLLQSCANGVGEIETNVESSCTRRSNVSIAATIAQRARRVHRETRDILLPVKTWPGSWNSRVAAT